MCIITPFGELNNKQVKMISILLLYQLLEISMQPLSLVTLILLIFVNRWLFFTNKNLPPSPWKLPVIGNLHQLGLHPHRSLRSLALRHGPIMLLHLGRKPTLVISSADLARDIMKTHDILFANRPDSSIARRLLYDYRDLSMSPYGEYWRQMRSICVLRLLCSKRVQSFRALREEETIEMTKKVERTCLGSAPVDLSAILVSLTKNVICRAAFGTTYDEGEAGRKLKKLLEELGELLGVFRVGDYIPCLGWVDKLTGLDARVIEDHMARHDVGNAGLREEEMDFLHVLLDIQSDSTDGICMAGENMKAIILDMFAGGTDTTYTALEWALTELLQHPEAIRKAQEEVRGIAGSGLYINEDQVQKLLYLKAVIKETLRLHPPLPLLLPRQPTKDVQVGAYDIPAMSKVIINAWAIGRDPATWEEAEEFRPERFLNSAIDFKGHDFELIPFGSGRRGCPGTTFAVATIELALASLLHKFDMTLPAGEAKGENLNVSESTGLVIHRKFPLVVIATPCSF